MTERFSGVVFRNGKENKPPTRPTMGEIGLNHFAPYLMNRIIARWNVNLADDLRGQDMSTSKMRALAVLSVSTSMTINELSVFAVTEQSTMSRTLDALEEQGLIRRVARVEDMRVRDVSITEDGRAAFEQAWPSMYDSFLRMFDGVDEDEYRAFTSTLHKILLNIRKHAI